jgi:molybdopterin/thiamine biosynthesis adenylyltransferase
VRDEQVRRYARHILLPDLGGLGQTALLVSAARVDLRDGDPAAMVAACYLAAGGVGTVVLRGATDAQLARLGTYGPDTTLVTDRVWDEITATRDEVDRARDVPLPPRPPWWPTVAGDDTALAFWRGGIAATAWMANVANR